VVGDGDHDHVFVGQPIDDAVGETIDYEPAGLVTNSGTQPGSLGE
jgi:hypothetical protein